MERVLFGFAVRRKQVKHVASARLGTEAWEALLESSCLADYILHSMAAAKHDNGDAVFDAASLEKARKRCVEGPLSLQNNY